MFVDRAPEEETSSVGAACRVRVASGCSHAAPDGAETKERGQRNREVGKQAIPLSPFLCLSVVSVYSFGSG